MSASAKMLLPHSRVMSMSMKPVLHSFAYCLDFLGEVADVAAADMVAQPNEPADFSNR